MGGQPHPGLTSAGCHCDPQVQHRHCWLKKFHTTFGLQLFKVEGPIGKLRTSHVMMPCVGSGTFRYQYRSDPVKGLGRIHWRWPRNTRPMIPAVSAAHKASIASESLVIAVPRNGSYEDSSHTRNQRFVWSSRFRPASEGQG